MRKKLIILNLFLGAVLFILTGCENVDQYSMEDKITEEIRYMENNLIEIVEDLTVNTSEEENSDKILQNTKKIEESTNRMMVDLATANVDNGEISKLSDGVGKMIIAVENDDKISYLAELNNIFALFPNYEAKVSNNSDEIFTRRLRYFTISTYIAFYLRR